MDKTKFDVVTLVSYHTDIATVWRNVPENNDGTVLCRKRFHWLQHCDPGQQHACRLFRWRDIFHRVWRFLPDRNRRFCRHQHERRPPLSVAEYPHWHTVGRRRQVFPLVFPTLCALGFPCVPKRISSFRRA